MKTDRMHRVWAYQGRKRFRRVLLAKFRMEIDAAVFADRLRRANPTWTVSVES